MEKLFNKGAKEELNAIIARLFCFSVLSFFLAINSFYAMTFSYDANNPFIGHIPHEHNKLRTSFCKNDKSNTRQRN